jgi:hypothetical protein
MPGAGIAPQNEKAAHRRGFLYSSATFSDQRVTVTVVPTETR